MKANKKIIISTLLLLTILTIIGGVSANDTPNETINNNNQEIIHKDIQSSLSDTSTTNKKSSSNDGKENINNIKSEEKKYDKLSSDEEAIYISTNGNDDNTGDLDKPVATIKKAINLTKTSSGKIIIKEGTYHENDITISGNKAINIIGDGNVIIDNNGLEEKSIFNIETKELVIKNIIFTNNKAKYGSAFNIAGENNINPLEVNILIDNCNFEDLEATRGGSIYVHYAKGTININNCNFTKSNAASGGVIYIQESSDKGGFNLKINNSKFTNNIGLLYLSRTGTINITNSIFYNNTAKSSESAIYINNCSTILDKCLIFNNSYLNNPLIRVTRRIVFNTSFEENEDNPSNNNIIIPTNLVITNCLIENNSPMTPNIPVIRLETSNLNISYSSIVNEFNIENTFITGDNLIGNITANNNWWGTNNPFNKISGSNIKIDNWIIMNVVLNASEINPGDNVKLSIDFNHVNTTTDNIEELNGWILPKKYNLKFTANKGSINQDSVEISYGETKEVIYTAISKSDIIHIKIGEFIKDIIFQDPSEVNYGPIYVAKNGDDNNNGNSNFPVASISKAIELACVDGGSGEIIIRTGTYNGNNYQITKDLSIIGEGTVVIDGGSLGNLFKMNFGVEVNKFRLSNLIFTGVSETSGALVYSFARELILDNITARNNMNYTSLIISNGNITIRNSKILNNIGGTIIDSSGKGNITIINTDFRDNKINTISNAGVIYVSYGKGNVSVENSRFINNSANHGVLITDSSDTNVVVKNSEFINNSNNKAYGGAIRSNNKINLFNSTFINNRAYRDGGAVYIGINGEAKINKCVFINNSANNANDTYHGDAIYNGNKLNINYSVLLTNTTSELIYNNKNIAVDLQYNWWGINDNPIKLIGSPSSSHDEDDEDYNQNSIINVANWVIMSVNLMSDSLCNDSKTKISVNFKHFIDLEGNIYDLADNIPELNISVSAFNGELDKEFLITKKNIAELIYHSIKYGLDEIKFTTGNMSIIKTINVSDDVVTSVSAIVKPETFINFFNNDGELEKFVNFKELIFTGEFNNLTITINKKINISGFNAVFNNSNIIIESSNVNLSNISFISDKLFDTSSMVYVDGENNTLVNNSFNYDAPSGSSYVIYVDSDSDGLKILNNKINYKGRLGEDSRTLAIYSLNSMRMVIKNNEIIATVPSVNMYDSANNMDIKTDGIFLENCGNIRFEDNNITVYYDGESSGVFNTIHALKLSKSDNAEIINNNIKVNGHSYTYGLTIDGKNIIIKYNNVESISDSDYACALQIDSDSSGFIENNNIFSSANDVSYGIYADDWGLGSELRINKNIVNVESNTAYGIMVKSKNAKITSNNIQSKGNYTTSLGFKNGDFIIENNIINANGSNCGVSTDVSPMVPIQTTGIYSIDANIIIRNNSIESSGSKTIDVDNSNGTIKDNKLILFSGSKGDVTISYSADSNLSIDNNKSSVDELVKPETGNSDTVISNPIKTEPISSTSKTFIPKQLIVAKNVKVKKLSKTLKIKVRLKKLNGKYLKNKRVILKFKGKKYSVKTNKKGVAIFKISKKVLRKLKGGKRYRYIVIYGKYKLSKKIIVKK